MLRRWDFRLVSSERGLEAVGKSVPLHIIGRSKAFDLFPRTHKGKNRCILRKKHALINSREQPLKSDINLEQSSHVETVVLLSQQKPDDTIEIDLDLDELDATSAELKATYQEIKDYVLKEFGLKVSSLYISQIKRKCGIEVGENYNLPKSENARVPQCPKEKEDAIKAALKYYAMI